MAKKERIETYTAAEIKKLKKKSKSDRKAARSLTHDEIEEAVADDPDSDFDLEGVEWFAGLPPLNVEKEKISVRIDTDVLAFYKRLGRGYQTRMNAVLRAYAEHHQ